MQMIYAKTRLWEERSYLIGCYGFCLVTAQIHQSLTFMQSPFDLKP